MFTRYSSILFFVVGIVPNKGTCVCDKSTVFSMVWLVARSLCCSSFQLTGGLLVPQVETCLVSAFFARA